jgi:hypothetical protein
MRLVASSPSISGIRMAGWAARTRTAFALRAE